MKYFVLLIALTQISHARIRVVTTTSDLAAIASEVGGSLVDVDAIAKGTQDPHFVEAKPSYMVKLNRADLLISIGLDLEIGWLPSIILGARNPRVNKGAKGFLEVGPQVRPLEVASGKITRADGDVHPFGNPHITLDPIRVGEIALIVAKKMGEVDELNAPEYQKNAIKLQTRLQEKTKVWDQRIQKSGIRKIITYHKTLTYFLDRFKIENPAILEPKPGIPPTSAHIIKLIQLIKTDKIPLILVENFFDPSVAQKIKSDVPDIKIKTVPISVHGNDEAKDLDTLFEILVRAIEGK